MILICACILFFLWLVITWITRGLSPDTVSFLTSFFPSSFHTALVKLRNGFYYDVPNQLMPSEVFFCLFSLGFIIYFLAIFWVTKHPPHKKQCVIIVVFAIVFRVMLIPSIPIHENDIYRYLWDGKVSSAGINPYRYAPRDVQIEPDTENTQVQRYFEILQSLRNESGSFCNIKSYRFWFSCGYEISFRLV